MKLGFLQFEPRFGRVPENLDRVGACLAGVRADLIVLPELANTGYNFAALEELESLAEPVPDGPSSVRFAAIARREGMNLIAGITERDGSGAFYNSAALFTPRGHAGTYRKVHLYSREKLFFAPGDRGFPVFKLDLADEPRIGIMICFDWRFPEAARSLALAGADIIVHPSNLLLPLCQAAMVTRCLENRVYAVTANRTGVEDRGGVRLEFTGRSQIVDPEGSVLASASDVEECLTITEIDPAMARRKKINAYNDLLEDRRPAAYAD